MVNVTMNPPPASTPSEKVVANAKKSVTVTDSRGRNIVVQKPNVLDPLRLVDILGASASNEVYLNMVYPLLYVQTIDGHPLAFSTKIGVEASYSVLGEEGLRAVVDAISEHFKPKKNDELEESAKK